MATKRQSTACGDAVHGITRRRMLGSLGGLVGFGSLLHPVIAKEIAEKQGISAYLIDDAGEIKTNWLAGKKSVAVTAGASAPEVLVEQVVQTLREHGGLAVREVAGIKEEVVFSLPRELVKAGEQAS